MSYLAKIANLSTYKTRQIARPYRVGCLFVYVRVFGDTLQDMNGNPLLFLYMPIGGCRRRKIIFMEIFWFFGFITSVVLSFIIANAGAKRQIGFGWSLFLGLWLTPIVSLIAVLLSDKLQADEYGRLEKKWGCLAPFAISFLIIGTVAYVIYSYSNKGKQRTRTSVEFRMPEFLKNETSQKESEDVIQPTLTNSHPQIEETVPVIKPQESVSKPSTKKDSNPANEIEVDLNDFLGTPNDGTDWNYTELSEEYHEALASKGVYYSENKGTWVMERSRKEKEDAEIAKRRRQKVERQYANQATCRIVYELNGRQAENILPIENVDSKEGFIYLKIEVSPNGDVVSCEIDQRSIIDDSKTRELCTSSAKNIKFNAINSKRNQSGMIRYIFTK